MRDKPRIESQDPGPLLDPAGGPPGEELLGIYDETAPDQDDEGWDTEGE